MDAKSPICLPKSYQNCKSSPPPKSATQFLSQSRQRSVAFLTYESCINKAKRKPKSWTWYKTSPSQDVEPYLLHLLQQDLHMVLPSDSLLWDAGLDTPALLCWSWGKWAAPAVVPHPCMVPYYMVLQCLRVSQTPLHCPAATRHLSLSAFADPFQYLPSSQFTGMPPLHAAIHPPAKSPLCYKRPFFFITAVSWYRLTSGSSSQPSPQLFQGLCLHLATCPLRCGPSTCLHRSSPKDSYSLQGICVPRSFPYHLPDILSIGVWERKAADLIQHPKGSPALRDTGQTSPGGGEDS